jgi:hypothetical protein
MRENKRKKISNKPTCPACGAVITVRCEAWHNRLGRCLRHSHHTGPHYFAAKSIQDDPIFWEALQDPWTVVYFPKPGELGRDPRDAGELERGDSGKWRTCDVPDDFHDVLIAEVELSSGSREYYLCSIDDAGEMVDSESGDSLGWQYDCITRWVPFDEVLTWLKG